jgi:hypothetical protein
VVDTHQLTRRRNKGDPERQRHVGEFAKGSRPPSVYHLSHRPIMPIVLTLGK